MTRPDWQAARRGDSGPIKKDELYRSPENMVNALRLGAGSRGTGEAFRWAIIHSNLP
jgi:hypothetical protein